MGCLNSKNSDGNDGYKASHVGKWKNSIYYYYYFDTEFNICSMAMDTLTIKHKSIHSINELYLYVAKNIQVSRDKIRIHGIKTYRHDTNAEILDVLDTNKTTWQDWEWLNSMTVTNKQIFVAFSLNVFIKYYHDMFHYVTYEYRVFGSDSLIETIRDITKCNVILSSLIVKIDNKHDIIVNGYLKRSFGDNISTHIYPLISKYYCGDMDVNIDISLYQNNIYTDIELSVYKDWTAKYIEYDKITDDIFVKFMIQDSTDNINSDNNDTNDDERKICLAKVDPKDNRSQMEQKLREQLLIEKPEYFLKNMDRLSHVLIHFHEPSPSYQNTTKTVMDYKLYDDKYVFVSLRSHANWIGN